MPEIVLPNAASLHALPAWCRVNHFDQAALNQDWTLRPSTNYVFMQPFALAQLAAWGAEIQHGGGSVSFVGDVVKGLPYPIRMGLFEKMGIETEYEMEEHEPSGRFVPLTNIRTAHQLDAFLTELYPLFHIPKASQDAIQYCLSELTRNVLEHANSPRGAFACAQYFAKSHTVSIGVADAGWGIRNTIGRNYEVGSDLEAINVAMRPGTSGAPKAGNALGTENAGAGLFFTKTISRLGGRQFGMVSGDAFYRLRKQQKQGVINVDPAKDNHLAMDGCPPWNGTVVGLDINTQAARQFERIIRAIREAFGAADPTPRKDYTARVRFK